VTDEHQSSEDDQSDPVRDVSDINTWARGGSMSKIPITTPSPQATGGTVVDAATPRRSSPSSLIVIVALSAIVGVVLAITLGPWRDPPSTDDTSVAATISVPVTSLAATTSLAGTLATPDVVLPVAGENLEPDVNGLRGCERPSGWLQMCETADSGQTVMYAVVAGGPGLVAVGGTDPGCCSELHFFDVSCCEDDHDGPDVTLDAVVWTSVDGWTWSRVPEDEAVFGGPGFHQMFSVTVGGPGLVAVGRGGFLVDGEAEGSAAVWTSVDGLTWARVPHDEAVFGGDGDQQMFSVTVGGPGLVAVGFDGPFGASRGNAAVWTSPDGLTWARVPDDEALFGGDGRQRMLSVTAGGPGLVAVGSDGHPQYEYANRLDELAADAAVWTSVDGLTWLRGPHDEAVFGGPGEQRMDSVTVGGPGLVAVGSASRQGPDVPADDRDFDMYEAAVWTSVDGLTWSRVPDADVVAVSDDEPEAMLSVTAGGPGLVAVGGDSEDQCGSAEAIWTSPDGLTWSQLPDQSPCGGEASNDLRMISVTVGGSGLVAVGWDVKGAAVWNG
jgi:hypothetical protein